LRKYGVRVKKMLLRSIVAEIGVHHCTRTNPDHIFIKRKLKPTTVNTKASNLTQQGLKDWSDDALCAFVSLLTTP